MARRSLIRSLLLGSVTLLGACAQPAIDADPSAPTATPIEASAPTTSEAAKASRVTARLADADDLLFAIKRGGSFDVSTFFASGAMAPAAPRFLAQLDAGAAAPVARKSASKISLVEPPEPPDATTADDAHCPQGMALIEGESCFDVKHKCTDSFGDAAQRCRQFDPAGDECVPPKKQLRYCMDRYEWPGVPGAKPQVVVTYFQAENYCKSVGKRMCEEQEFYLACEGPEHWPFAWGHTRYPSTCNIDRPYSNVDWGKWSTQPYAEAKRLDQALPIGTSQCWSPYGVHDIAGNVDEWTHARPGREYLGSLNGGYWGPVANACRYVTTVHGPQFAFYQIGFRCCSDAKE